MQVNYSKLKEAIDKGDRKYANFYDTYGFLVIRGILNRQEFRACVKEYDAEYRRRTGEVDVWRMIINRLGFSGDKKYGFRHILKSLFRRGMSFLPYFAEDSIYFTTLLCSKKMTTIFEYFCGKNWLYLGSDGSRFSTTSFPWHRDWFTKGELMKCNFYFNTLPYLGGRFLLIPGSNNVNDIYTQRIQRSISWPMQNKKPSGMNENDYIPDVVNPRKKFEFRSIFNRSETFDVPHIKLKINKGDLVVFDQRLMHCVETSYPQVTRRLMTFLIGKNSFDYPENHELLQKYTREEIMPDLLDLIVNERNHIGCPPWGKAFEESDLAGSNHYIKIEKVDGAELFNHSEIRTSGGIKYSSKVNFEKYANIGANYRRNYYGAIKSSDDRMAQEFGYQDVHLGINSQNIKI